MAEPQGKTLNEIAETYPYSEEVEQAVIATVLYRPQWRDSLGAVIQTDFHIEGHQRLWAAIEAQMLRGQVVSALSVAAATKYDEAVLELGGSRYVNDIAVAMCPMTEASAAGIAKHLRELSDARRLKLDLETAIADIHDNPTGEAVRDQVSRLVDRLTGINDSSDPDMPQRATKAADALLMRADDTSLAPPVREVMTGIRVLDDALGGLREGESHAIGGRPGMGKTTLGTNIAVNAARAGKGVLFFSLEMKRPQIVSRLLCDLVQRQGHELWINALRKGNIPRYLIPPLIQAKDNLDALPLLIDDVRDQSLSKIAAKCRWARREFQKEGKDLDLVIVDYLTLMEPDERYRGQKVNEVTALSRGVKILAGDLGIPIIPLLQLNRNTENRANKDNRPQLSDIRESGAIEQDADSVTLLYREEYYVNHKRPALEIGPEWDAWKASLGEVKDRLELIVAKNREGEASTLQARILARCSAVRDK